MRKKQAKTGRLGHLSASAGYFALAGVHTGMASLHLRQFPTSPRKDKLGTAASVLGAVGHRMSAASYFAKSGTHLAAAFKKPVQPRVFRGNQYVKIASKGQVGRQRVGAMRHGKKSSGVARRKR